MNPATPVLFLDYDHVLHPFDVYRTADGLVPGTPGGILFEYAPLLEEALSPYPTVRIVLSTSWVHVLGYPYALGQLPIESLRVRVIGATYDERDDQAPVWSAVPRGAQILRYVRLHRLRRWLAVDDMRDGFEGYESHLVHCQQGVGLGDKDVQMRFSSMLKVAFAPSPHGRNAR